MTGPESPWRAGVDIGGTFTDVALDGGGTIYSAKVLTDHAAPERSMVAALAAAAASAGIGLDHIGLIIHGTTLVTNAVIERRGARIALVTTKGFRDVLEMRTESRFDQYDLDITLPTPLVARPDRFVLHERMGAGGTILIAPDPAEVDALAGRIADAGYASVAIGFLHSYANRTHERLMRDAILRHDSGISVSISSEVSAQMREFERFNTVAVNAYVKPLVGAYLGRLVEALRVTGATCQVVLMHSGGGLIAMETAAEFPVRLLESGPAGGAIFAADFARRHGLSSVLSFDMGGTTAKICLIEDATPKSASTFEVARSYRFKKGSGTPVSIPVVEMVEIGAGGGSIAGVDSLHRLRVGPESAGSEPGPAAYGHGGSRATVTDADLILGRIDPDAFAGGSIRLSVENARAAIARDVGSGLGLAVPAAAYGIAEIVDENMANAGRVHAVENGKDLASFTMIAFGGAGPIHAARLCAKMGMRRFLVPAGAGVGSAIGFLRAPFSYEAVRSAPIRLDQFDADAVNRIVTALATEAGDFVRAVAPGVEPAVTLTAQMRYVGQGWEIPVPLPVHSFVPEDGDRLAGLFAAAYVRMFGRTVAGLAVEVVSWSTRVSIPYPAAATVPAIVQASRAPPSGRRRVFDEAAGDFAEAAVHGRAGLRPGAHIEGPAIIVEGETSTLVPTAFAATVLADGSLLVTRAGA